MRNLPELEAAIKSLVAKLEPNDSVFSIGRLQAATAECLTEVRQEAKRLGEEEVFFWNLVMYDQHHVKAVFLITVFNEEVLRVYAGLGKPHEVVALCNQFSMVEVSKMEAAFEEEYKIGENSIEIPRALAEFWLSST